MEQKPLQITEFMGKNNVLQPEEVAINEFQIVKNVYVNDAQKIRRRQGYRLIYSGSVRSLYSTGSAVLFREGTDLKRLEPDNSATVIRSGIQGGREMAYLTIADRTFLTDGVITGVYQYDSCRTWGLEVPEAPILTVEPGILPAGTYQVALTFVREDGQEGGAPSSATIRLPGDSGIRLDNISMSLDPTVAAINVYLTPTNGEQAFRVGTIANGVRSMVYSGNGKGTSPLLTQFMTAPPAGQLMAYYNGRIYIAAGNILWHTEKDYAIELISQRKGFIPFPSRITMLAPVKNGIWISTLSEIGFMGGDCSRAQDYETKANYAAIEGTAKKTDGKNIGTGEISGDLWLWTTTRGICYGAKDGAFGNLTDGRVRFPPSLRGVAAIKHEPDAKLYIVGLYVSNVGEISIPMLTASGTGYESAPP